MDITCTPHGYHMHTSWVSHVHLMGIRFTLPLQLHFPKIFHRGCMNFKWSSPLLSHLDITCTPHGHHMHTSWVSHAHLMGITCTHHGYHMYTSWVSHVHIMGITCTPHGYHMHTSWVSHVHLMGITCTPHGYHMYTSWVSDSHFPCSYTFPESSTGGVWILNGVAQYNTSAHYLETCSQKKKKKPWLAHKFRSLRKGYTFLYFRGSEYKVYE